MRTFQAPALETETSHALETETAHELENREQTFLYNVIYSDLHTVESIYARRHLSIPIWKFAYTKRFIGKVFGISNRLKKEAFNNLQGVGERKRLLLYPMGS